MMTDNVKALPRVGFWKATMRGFKGIFDFEGRARRSEYWWYALVVYLILCLLLIGVTLYIVLVSGNYIKGHDHVGEFSWLDTLLMFDAAFLPYALCFAIQVRRLHDVGRSALWPSISFMAAFFSMVLCAIAIESIICAVQWSEVIGGFIVGILMPIGAISWLVFLIAQLIILIFSLKDSQLRPNKYGDSPKYVEY